MSVAARIELTFPDAALLRRHSPPLQRRLDAICEMLEKSGIHINPASAHDIQASLEEIADPDTRATVENILTGPMQRALYFSTHSIDKKSGYSHYALNVPLYTHFTSPIRRYADVIVHRTLEASLACFGNHVAGDHPLLPRYFSPYFPDTLPEGSMTVSKSVAESLLIPDSVQISQIANHCNQRRDAAKKAQDASSDLYLAHYLEKVGKSITTPGVLSLGVVTKIGQNGIDVLVPMFGVEATVFMDRMADKTNQVITTDGREWKLVVWKTEPAQITLVWQAKPPPSVDSLTNDISALVIDDARHTVESFGRTEYEDSTT
ncbi:Translational repressor, partial [Linderina macrospora]